MGRPQRNVGRAFATPLPASVIKIPWSQLDHLDVNMNIVLGPQAVSCAVRRAGWGIQTFRAGHVHGGRRERHHARVTGSYYGTVAETRWTIPSCGARHGLGLLLSSLICVSTIDGGWCPAI